jgi:hypothetical protein
MLRLLTLACILPACLSVANAQEESATATPLFNGDEMLNVRIIAPFDVLAQERPVDEYVAGTFYLDVGDGELVELDVGLRTRGNYRRRQDVCSFPPLRLNFKKKQVKETLFDGQDKLKLVTHCTTDSFIYEQGIIAEYLAYRILNLMTDYSYRVRLLLIEYETTGTDKSFDGYGILIEHKDSVTERLEIAPLSVETAPVSTLDLDYLNLTSVYQYLIGNTDFSPISGAAGAECCHNHTLFGNEGEPYYSIPYDFDMSGFVGAPYATPNPKLRLDSVQERLYRGRCVNNDLLPETLAAFTASRDEIEALIREQPELSGRKRRDILKYIDQFYRSVSNNRGIDRNLVRKCK